MRLNSDPHQVPLTAAAANAQRSPSHFKTNNTQGGSSPAMPLVSPGTSLGVGWGSLQYGASTDPASTCPNEPWQQPLRQPGNIIPEDNPASKRQREQQQLPQHKQQLALENDQLEGEQRQHQQQSQRQRQSLQQQDPRQQLLDQQHSKLDHYRGRQQQSEQPPPLAALPPLSGVCRPLPILAANADHASQLKWVCDTILLLLAWLKLPKEEDESIAAAVFGWRAAEVSPFIIRNRLLRRACDDNNASGVRGILKMAFLQQRQDQQQPPFPAVPPPIAECGPLPDLAANADDDSQLDWVIKTIFHLLEWLQVPTESRDSITTALYGWNPADNSHFIIKHMLLRRACDANSSSGVKRILNVVFGVQL